MMNYSFGYQQPEEEQLVDPYAATTDFGRVSMGQAPEAQAAPVTEAQPAAVDQQAETATVMNQANIDASGDLGQAIQAQQVVDPTAFQYTSVGATDTEALGEGMFAFGLAMLAASSQPGADFGASMAQGLAAGSKTFSSALNRNKRYENIKALEEKGYTQESIDAYIQSGDNKSLVKAPTQNFIKTKELNGTLYQYDERNPAATMKPVQAGPKQVKGSVDLGNKVLIHYTDGSTEERDKGMTPAQAAKASGSGSGTGTGKKGKVSAIDPNDIRVITSPDGVKMGHAYPTTDKETGITTWHDAGTGEVLEVPRGSTFQKDPDYSSSVAGNKKSFSEAQEFGVGLSGSAKHIRTLLNSGANPYDLTRLVPRTASSEDTKTFANARSALMMGNYKSMPGIAGMSAATEKTMLETIPDETASPAVKAAWAKPLVQANIDYLENYIEQQEEFGSKVPASIKKSLDEMRALQTELDNVGQAQPKATKKAPVRAPSSNVGTPMSAYGAAAQAQPAKSDFSNLW